MAFDAPNPATSAAALAVALLIHAAAMAVLLRVDPERPRRSEVPVEFEVERAPPPPPPATPPEPPPPPEPLPARPIRRPRQPHDEPPSPLLAPPPPNQQAASNPVRNAPPVFGVTMSSVVSGGQAAMAVPVGNTTMTKDRGRTDTPAQPYPSDGSKPFVAEPDLYIATRAQLLHEVDSEEFYPARARTLGIEGTVETVLDIDEKGNVVAVRITRRAGHEFDEAASRALKQFRFKPARASDGRAVPSRLGWKYTFTMKN